MKKISISPERNSFQKENFLKRRLKEGRTPENDSNVKAMVEFYDSVNKKENENLENIEWRKNNLEYDLRSTEWILEKARNSDSYAQNLYAALCNNEFIKNDVWPILNDTRWGCSWRYSGAIIANMLEKGDYIDWYCSGSKYNYDEDLRDGYISEGYVTEEIRQDLLKLGWIVASISEID